MKSRQFEVQISNGPVHKKDGSYVAIPIAIIRWIFPALSVPSWCEEIKQCLIVSTLLFTSRRYIKTMIILEYYKLSVL